MGRGWSIPAEINFEPQVYGKNALPQTAQKIAGSVRFHGDRVSHVIA
jgi:hypothetical protein